MQFTITEESPSGFDKNREYYNIYKNIANLKVGECLTIFDFDPYSCVYNDSFDARNFQTIEETIVEIIKKYKKKEFNIHSEENEEGLINLLKVFRIK